MKKNKSMQRLKNARAPRLTHLLIPPSTHFFLSILKGGHCTGRQAERGCFNARAESAWCLPGQRTPGFLARKRASHQIQGLEAVGLQQHGCLTCETDHSSCPDHTEEKVAWSQSGLQFYHFYFGGWGEIDMLLTPLYTCVLLVSYLTTLERQFKCWSYTWHRTKQVHQRVVIMTVTIILVIRVSGKKQKIGTSEDKIFITWTLNRLKPNFSSRFWHLIGLSMSLYR